MRQSDISRCVRDLKGSVDAKKAAAEGGEGEGRWDELSGRETRRVCGERGCKERVVEGHIAESLCK